MSVTESFGPSRSTAGSGGPDGSRGSGPPDGHPWRRVALVAVLLIVGILGVDELGDLTQSRADSVPPGSRSEIVLEIDTRGYRQPVDDAAANLWGACAGIVRHRLDSAAGFEPVGDDGDEVRFWVEPGLGRNAERKLVGCLEDATLDRVVGDVESVRLIVP